MKKVVEEANSKISVLHAENFELKVEKEAVKVGLDKIFDDSLELLNQSFFQAYVLYNVVLPSGDFNPENEVFEGRILSRVEVRALESPTQPVTTEGAEGED